jgi:membrane-bound serine protease (ClpP class)
LRALRILVAVALLTAFAAGVIPIHAQIAIPQCDPKGYYVASLNGDIDPGAADFMTATVNNAESGYACNIVFVLTTNGGDGGDMESMISSISSYQQWGGRFITLVAPEGAYAFSAGSYLAQASDKIYMEPGTTIGSATPIVSGIPTGETNTTLTKDINAFSSYMQTLTEAHGRNGTATGLMVTGGVSYACATAADCQALKSHVVDGVINSTTLEGALAYLGVPPGTQVNTPALKSTFISVLSDPNVSSLLFLVGVFAILFDVYHPTLLLSIIGVVVIALALFGLGVFGASPLAIFLMIVGAAFIFLEVKTQHGISAAVGVVVFVVGFFLVFQLPPASSNPLLPPANFIAIPDVTYGLLVALGVAIVIGSLYLRRIRQALVNRPKANDPARLVGKEGAMESDLVPGGKGVAQIESELWSVTSSQELSRGERVRVKAVIGLELTVEKAQG